MRRILFPSLTLAALACAACSREKTGTITGPATAIHPQLTTVSGSPVSAGFVDLDPRSPGGYAVSHGDCTRVVIAVVKGSATAGATSLAEGDVLVTDHDGDVALSGSGTALVAVASDAPDCMKATWWHTDMKVARAGDAPELTFMKGTMHAHLDVTDGPVYIGRLSGTGAVPPHRHDGSWEIAAPFDGAGTFAIEAGNAELAGIDAGAYSADAGPPLVPHRLVPRQIVMMPAGRFHSWTPDPGATLVGVQMYYPPGPEQRFKKLAAAEADAGK